MADKNSKVNKNVSGKYYVDTNCSACAVCEGMAPDIFKMTDDGVYAYVVKQPENTDEEKLCKEVMEACPVEAIGEDGE